MNQAHADMDDCGEWAESHPMTQRAHRAPVLPERHYTAPQGRESQGWPVRRCSPEMACWVPEDQTESADRDVAMFVLRLAAGICAAAFAAWLVGAW